MKKILLIVFFLLFVSGFGCKTNCPAFNSDLLRWIPSNEGEKNIYINNYGDTLIITYASKIISDAYKLTNEDKNDCVSYASQNAIKDNEYNFYFEINQHRQDIGFSLNLEYYLNGYYYPSYLGFRDANNKITSIILNGIEYNEALIIETDTIKDNESLIWKAIMAKDYGLVAFYNRATKEEWILSP
jgi:hypothetical protein